MAEYKVVKRFVDKETKKKHDVSKDGETIELTDERAAEIKKAGNFIELVKKEKKDNKASTKETKKDTKK